MEVRSDSVMVRFTDTDLRLAVQALARHLEVPVVFGHLGENRVTLEMRAPVPRDRLPEVLRGILEVHGYDLELEEGVYRVGRASPRPQQTAEVTGPTDVQLFIIRLRHGRAPDIAATVNALYGRASAFGELGRPGGTLSEQLRQQRIPPESEEAPPGRRPVVDQFAELEGDVTIVPDARTNSLLIRASRWDFDLIHAAVEELDVRPLQVLIEVVIAEVRRDRGLNFGVEAVLPPQTIRGTDTEISAHTEGVGLGDLVVDVMRLGRVDLSATLSAAASRGDVSILSRPVLLAANNEPAEIMVGAQRPFVQVQRALPTDAPVRDQVVQFRDVGTRLTVVPTVSDDGFVMLEVVQEVNAATAEVAFDAPVISTRSIQTRLLVHDGHTAILGGLADRQRDVTRSGVPLLSAIPIIGGLFGRHATRTVETELFVFLTPRVIRTDEELDAASEGVGDRTRELRREW